MLVNGNRQSEISINNRGLAYGDGLFETILINNGNLVLLDRHLNRLQSGLELLNIQNCMEALKTDISLIKDELGNFDVLKIIVSRGSGGRGYSPSSEAKADRIISLHHLSNKTDTHFDKGIKSFISDIPLALQTHLAGLKHLNRLEQVLASRDWPGEEYFEAVMLDTNGCVIEGTKSNIFLELHGQLITPDLRSSGVKGVLRDLLLEELPVEEKQISLPELYKATEIFFCNSVGGVWPVTEFYDGSISHLFNVGAYASKAQNIFQQAIRQANL